MAIERDGLELMHFWRDKPSGLYVTSRQVVYPCRHVQRTPQQQASTQQMMLAQRIASGGGVITFINSVSAGSADQLTVTTGNIDTSGANFFAGVVADYSGNPATTVSDSKGNTWADLTASISGLVRVRLVTSTNATSGAGHNFSASSGSLAVPTICMLAFSNVKTSSPLDQQNGADSGSGAVASIQTGSVTPSENNELIVTGIGGGNVSESIDSGFDNPPTEEVAFLVGLHFYAGISFLIQTTLGAVNPTWTPNLSDYQATWIATFKKQ